MENKYITLNEFNLKKLNSDYDSDTDSDKNCDIYNNNIVVTNIDLDLTIYNIFFIML